MLLVHYNERRTCRLSFLAGLSLLALVNNFKFVDAAQRVIIIGGSSGMGKAAAYEILRENGEVLLVSRSRSKLVDARNDLIQRIHDGQCSPKRQLMDSIRIEVCDITQEKSVEELALLLKSKHFDGLVITAAGKAPHGPLLSLPSEETKDLLNSKLWGAYYCSKYLSPLLIDGGSVVFCAGILSRRPGLNCSPLAIANGALEGLTRSLALEWGPRLRVNCLSPGFCDTERFDHMDDARRRAMMENTASSLPLERVGKPVDMGQAINYLLNAKFCTGVVLDVDGGHGIRQYAYSSTDPMRRKNH